MHDILFDLLHDYAPLPKAQDARLRSMPDYPVLRAQMDAAEQALQETLSQEGKETYLEYEAAKNAMASLSDDASVLTGCHLAVRLLVELLTL